MLLPVGPQDVGEAYHCIMRSPRVPIGHHKGSPADPRGPPILHWEHPVSHPTLNIIGFTLVKRAFMKVTLFRHGVDRGRRRRDPRAPKGPQRVP